jgi:phenylpyruvate tautomerase PptA (4-oxalocrotonate tautomerase family)
VPAASIEVRRQYSKSEETALIDAVQTALIAALKVPARTTLIRLFVHEPHRFSAPADKSDRYTLVTIDCFAGRSAQTKRALYEAIVKNLSLCAIPTDHIKILLREGPRENWAIRGGLPASDFTLEYDVDI